MENITEVPQKVENRSTIRSSDSSPGYQSEENKNTNLERYLYSYVYCSIIYSSQNIEAT